MRAGHRDRRGRHGGRGRSYLAGLFQGMDDDGNEAISRAELGNKAPRLVERFAAIDTDRNGELSRAELRAHHAAMRAEHGGDGGRPPGEHPLHAD